MTPAPQRAAVLRELAGVFLRLGATSFGGPAAHIAMMEDEFVARRRWVTREEFADLLGATNLIPGPNSTEMAIHIGRVRAGFPGLVVAGACFILPAFIIVAILAHLYVEFGEVPAVGGVVYAVKPVVIGVVAQALVRLARTVIKGWVHGLLALACAAGVVLGAHELVVLAAAALVGGLSVAVTRPHGQACLGVPLVIAGGAPAGVVAAASSVPVSMGGIFLLFLKIGSVLFGSGYVLLAFLRADLVERYGWLTEEQLLDAVAVGQVTPGPVFTTATFIGYVLQGPAGAVVATVGIFLPAFFFVVVTGPFIPKLRRSRTLARVLDAVNVASLALMAIVSAQLAVAALVDIPTLLLGGVSAWLLLRWNVNSAWLVLGAAAVGAVMSLAGMTPP